MKYSLFAAALGLALLGAAPTVVTPPPEPTLAGVQRLIPGTWQSTDDAKFTREFDANGQAADRYQGDKSADMNGTWQLFRGDSPPTKFAGKTDYVSDAIYLAVTEGGDTQLFAIDGIDARSLDMIYLDRGNTLSFKRIH